MALFARHIRFDTAWVEVSEDTYWEDGDFPFGALNELSEGRAKGLSVFKVPSAEISSVVRIAAALCLASQDQETGRQMQFRFVEMRSIEEIGVYIRQNPGKLSDNELNERHFEITGLTGPKAVELMRRMRNPIIQVNSAEIFNQIVVGLRERHFPPETIKGKLLLQRLGQHYRDETGRQKI
jgi:hypothetical protein